MALVKFVNNSEPYLSAENLNNNFDIMHPIGSIYLSVEPTNPSNYFGGTWEEFGKGKVLVGVDSNDSDFNTVEKTGGEKEHTQTVSEMPSHNHSLPIAGTSGSATYLITGTTTANRVLLGTVGDKGGGQPFNIMQPYITCYMWKRIA